MVKYYCDMCKLEKKKSEIRILQTKQPDGSIQTNHLCDTCCSTITELCKTYLSAPGQVGELPEDKLKAEEKVEGVKRPKAGKKRKEEATELEEFEVSKEVTHAEVATARKKNFNIDPSKFRDYMPKAPRSGSVQNVQRALLCIYKGMTLAETERTIKQDYQNVYRWKSNFASKIIAERHLESKRMDAINICVIDGFIEGNTVEELSYNHNVSIQQVKDILEFYTGFTW